MPALLLSVQTGLPILEFNFAAQVRQWDGVMCEVRAPLQLLHMEVLGGTSLLNLTNYSGNVSMKQANQAVLN